MEGVEDEEVEGNGKILLIRLSLFLSCYRLTYYLHLKGGDRAQHREKSPKNPKNLKRKQKKRWMMTN